MDYLNDLHEARSIAINALSDMEGIDYDLSLKSGPIRETAKKIALQLEDYIELIELEINEIKDQEES
jgi:hypothetical protein